MKDSESPRSPLQGEMSKPATKEELQVLIDTMTPEIYDRLKEAVALRRWPDSSRLSSAQLENAMQLIILYEHNHLPPAQHTGQKLTASCSDAAQPVTLKMDTAEITGEESENSG